MKAKIITDVKVQLTLDIHEALWLKGLVQNYMGQGEEPSQHKMFRKLLFDTLNDKDLKDRS